MDRETSVETRECPNCGTHLAVVGLPDGATSTVLCQNCYGPAKAEKAAAEPELPREHGVEDDEDGDDD